MSGKARTPGRFKTAVAGAIEGWLGRPISLTDGGFWSQWLGNSSYAGKTVTVDSALQQGTAWACVRLISETLSTLPMNLYREQRDGSKGVAKDHQLHYLLHSQPNADMTAAVFWQCLVASLLLWGNAYVEKRSNGVNLTSLDFLMPACLTCRRLDNGDREWRYHDPVTHSVRTIAAQSMWHVPGFTLDGLTGLSPIRYGVQVLGSAMATDEASARTFRFGMRASTAITMDKIMTPPQREDVRVHVAKVAASGGVLVLEKGAGVHQLSMNPEDAQMLQTRAFNVEEICRWFRVPPFMVGHAQAGKTNWGTGIESEMIGFVTFVLRPWCVRIEQSVRKDLLTPVERLSYSAEFALEGLLRGDSAARAAFYSQMVQNGVMTRDDCRRLENLAAMGGNAGVLTVQSNLLPIDQLGTAPAADSSAAQNALKNWLGILERQTPQ